MLINSFPNSLGWIIGYRHDVFLRTSYHVVVRTFWLSHRHHHRRLAMHHGNAAFVICIQSSCPLRNLRHYLGHWYQPLLFSYSDIAVEVLQEKTGAREWHCDIRQWCWHLNAGASCTNSTQVLWSCECPTVVCWSDCSCCLAWMYIPTSTSQVHSV